MHSLVLIVSYASFPTSSVFSMSSGSGAWDTCGVSTLITFVFLLHAMWVVEYVKRFVQHTQALSSFTSTTTSASLSSSTPVPLNPALTLDIYPDTCSLSWHAYAALLPMSWLAAASL
ncbi:hypothetical protein B0H17DRAFT_1212041 [Mycena rosella]|uniref:Uncharacterized protein n=1 Tax=Mycena rosella TaxID=1033263 RepID=A0AAD7CST7_MYCRO|nr:hypothetical protein B0H17DRAFT_1212041 [Mycena rosella]